MNRAAGSLKLIIRVGLAALFAYAAVGKLADPNAFAEAIDNYRVLPPALAPWLALVLPPVEVAVAVGLLTPWLSRGSALSSSVMLVVFAAAMVQAQLRGIDLDCGCFGAEGNAEVGLPTILRNVILAAAGLWVAVSGPAGRSTTEAGV